MKQPHVYILASARNGTLYVGVTSQLVQRIWQHINHVATGFSQRYGVDQLVWFEAHSSMEEAILREKQIKSGSRKRKLDLIETMNPDWRDLYEDILGG
jgi:putative endonuclease